MAKNTWNGVIQAIKDITFEASLRSKEKLSNSNRKCETNSQLSYMYVEKNHVAALKYVQNEKGCFECDTCKR